MLKSSVIYAEREQQKIYILKDDVFSSNIHHIGLFIVIFIIRLISIWCLLVIDLCYRNDINFVDYLFSSEKTTILFVIVPIITTIILGLLISLICHVFKTRIYQYYNAKNSTLLSSFSAILTACETSNSVTLYPKNRENMDDLPLYMLEQFSKACEKK